MLVFGCSITAPDVYTRCAARGFRLVAEPDSEIIANSAAGSLFRSYNLILEAAAKHDDLEALVLVHQDAEIVDPDEHLHDAVAFGDGNMRIVSPLQCGQIRRARLRRS